MASRADLAGKRGIKPDHLNPQVPQPFEYGSVEKVLRTVVAAVEARCGAVILRDAENHSPSMVVSCGPFPTLNRGMTVARWVANHGEPLALETRQQASPVPGLTVDAAEELPLICVPIQSKDGTLGALQANVSSLAGDEDISHKLRTLRLAADFVGCILENARLHRELQQKEKDVTRLVKTSIKAQEAERERICLEVHDGVAQTLASAFQYLQTLENTPLYQMPEAKQLVTRAVGLVRQAIQEARDVINSLTPATLRDLGLVATLRQELKQFEAETGRKVEFESNLPRLSRDTEIALYRIVHEAVTNVKKHAHSRRMRIQLGHGEDRLIAQVKDWGVGFDVRQHDLAAASHGTGLFSMRKRAELLGGSCQVHSALGKGTLVQVEVPAPDQ
ncbi:MAG: GAF domain-containing sensor histidine kinase [Anaerolineae bacterium]